MKTLSLLIETNSFPFSPGFLYYFPFLLSLFFLFYWKRPWLIEWWVWFEKVRVSRERDFTTAHVDRRAWQCNRRWPISLETQGGSFWRDPQICAGLSLFSILSSVCLYPAVIIRCGIILSLIFIMRFKPWFWCCENRVLGLRVCIN